jgi:hypothetical protein
VRFVPGGDSTPTSTPAVVAILPGRPLILRVFHERRIETILNTDMLPT